MHFGPEGRLDSFSELFQVRSTISEWYLSYGQVPIDVWITRDPADHPSIIPTWMNDFFLDDVLGILGFTSPFWTSEIIISSYTFEIVAGEKEKGTCNNLQLSQRSLWSRAWWYLFPCCCRSSRSKPYAKNHVRKETRDKNKTNRKREWSPLPTLLNDGKHVKLRLKKKGSAISHASNPFWMDSGTPKPPRQSV